MTHYNVRIWRTYEDRWINDMPTGEPTTARYYDTRLTAAKQAAKQACDNGASFAEVVTTSGEVVISYANCGPLGTGWVE